MKDSFTDELIEELDKDEKDAKRAEISRLAVLKETIEDIEGQPVFFVYLAFICLTLFFCVSTYGWAITNTQIPRIEEGMFQVFEVRGVSVEELNQNDHTLSGVLENMEIGFVELEELAQQEGVVYYSRKPSTRFFVVSEHWDVVYYYVNDRLGSAYSQRRSDSAISPVTGICLLVLVTLVYKRYKIKYKEMAGF